MLRQKRSPILILLLTLIVAAVSWSGWVAHRQTTLDRALIAAVTKDDATTTATLLAEGADSNTKDWHERESHGWLERAQHLLTGRFYAANPEPVLAIAMQGNNAQVAQILKQHGADEDAAVYWKVASEWPNEDVAITNGIHLLHGIAHPSKSDALPQSRNWLGKRVAFCVDEMPDRALDAGISVEIELKPANATFADPLGLNLYSVKYISLLGTV